MRILSCSQYYLAKMCFNISHHGAVTGCEADILRCLQRSFQRLFVIFLGGEDLPQLILGAEYLSHQSSDSLPCTGRCYMSGTSINHPKQLISAVESLAHNYTCSYSVPVISVHSYVLVASRVLMAAPIVLASFLMKGMLSSARSSDVLPTPASPKMKTRLRRHGMDCSNSSKEAHIICIGDGD